jgi:hypothetical protein
MKPLNFFNTISHKNLNLVLPKNIGEIGEYSTNFERAVAFTKSCGFPIDNLSWHGGDVLDRDGNFVMPPLHSAGVRDLNKSAAQCLKWCHYLAPAFEQHLGFRVWVTIGQIWNENTAVFSPTWDDIKRWSKYGIQIDDFRDQIGLNLHAWLTVESGEIIEPTFPSSMAACGNKAYANFAGAVIWGRDPHILSGHRHFPMAVGRDFVEAISEKSIFPLLANNPEELHQYAAFC